MTVPGLRARGQAAFKDVYGMFSYHKKAAVLPAFVTRSLEWQ